MKRVTALLLAAMLTLSLSSCSAKPNSPETPIIDENPDIQQGTVILPETDDPSQQTDPPAGEFPSPQDPLPKPDPKPDPNPDPTPTPEPEPKPDPEPKPEPEPEPEPEPPAVTPPTTAAPSEEYRAVWISYLELGNMLTGKTKAQFRSNIAAAYDNAVDLGCNTVIVHVRPFGDALYDSDLFPSSYLITGTEGDTLPFDPLAIMVEEAHSRSLTFEAWLNPYRVRASAGKPLASHNPAQQFLNQGSSAVYQYNNGVYYNPGSRDAIDLIVDGVREIVQNYDVDAIHFDDYFYATTAASIDSSLYAAYQSGGGNLSLANWRRQNVNTMIREVYAAIKAEDSTVRFGISPQGNTPINYNSLYADVATWLSAGGYVDYICPQIYYGFYNKTCPFETVLNEFENMIRVDSIDLYVGLAAYKIGKEDTYAGTNGKYEWQNNSDMLSRMVRMSREMDHYAGYALYSYSSVVTPAAAVKDRVSAELAALADIL